MIIEKYDITNNLVKIMIGWGICTIIAVSLHELIEKKLVFVLKKKALKM